MLIPWPQNLILKHIESDPSHPCSNFITTTFDHLLIGLKILRHSLKVSKWTAVTRSERGLRTVTTIIGEARTATLHIKTSAYAHAHDHPTTNDLEHRLIDTRDTNLSQAAVARLPSIIIAIIHHINPGIIRVASLKLWLTYPSRRGPCQKPICLLSSHYLENI